MEISYIHTEISFHLHVNKTTFHMKGFALGLAMKGNSEIAYSTYFRTRAAMLHATTNVSITFQPLLRYDPLCKITPRSIICGKKRGTELYYSFTVLVTVLVTLFVCSLVTFSKTLLYGEQLARGPEAPSPPPPQPGASQVFLQLLINHRRPFTQETANLPWGLG